MPRGTAATAASGTTGTTCFVTGAGGFVGMHFVRTAMAAGCHVVALLHRPTEEPDEDRSRTLFRQKRRLLSLPDSHRRLTIVEGTLHDRVGLRAVFDEFEIDAVVHLAGVTRIPQATMDCAAAFEVNVEGTQRLAEEAERCASARGRAMHFAFSSTVCVFEGVSPEPADANASKAPRSPYAQSKALAEEALEARPGLSVTISYLPNLFGLGESSTVIPIWVQHALSGQPIPIWGDGTKDVRFIRVEPYCARLLETLRAPAQVGGLARTLEQDEYRVSLNQLAHVIREAVDGMRREDAASGAPDRSSVTSASSTAATKRFEEHIHEIGAYHMDRTRRPERPDDDFPATRIGVVGFGRWGPLVAARFAGIRDVRIAAVCNRGEAQRAHARLLYPRATIHERYQDLIDDGQVDAIVIATSPESHFAIAKHALERGTPVFLEKPMAAHVHEAVELAELSRARRVPLMINHSFVFEEAFQTIKGYLTEGRYGALRSFESVHSRPGDGRSLGAIDTLGVHHFALLDYLVARPPEAVSAECLASRGGRDTEVAVTLFYADSFTASVYLHLADVRTRMRRVRLGFGEHTQMVYDAEAEKKLVIRRQNETVTPALTRASDGLTEAVVGFLSAVYREAPLLSNAALGLRTMSVLDACHRSVATGRRCDVAQPSLEPRAPL